MLPTPQADTDPRARECPDGSLRGGALVALLLGVGPCPEGMAHGLRGPFHARVSQEGGALQAPMDPGVVAAALRHRRDARIRLQCISGEVACPLCAEGDEKAWGKDRASARQGGTHGEVGMALGALRDGVVEVCDRVQDDPELGDEGLDQQGLGGEHALIGGQRCGALDGLDTRGDDVDIAHVMGVEEALQGGAARELGGCEGRPVREELAEARGIVVVTPWQGVREVVFQGTGETVGDAHLVADQAAAVFDAWLEGTHLGAWGVERLPCVAMLEEELERQFGVRGIVCGMAGREGFTIRGQGPRGDGEQDQERVCTQGVDERAFVQFEAHRDGASDEPLPEGTCPCVDGLGGMLESTERPGVGADDVSADVVRGIGPIDTKEGSKRFLR